MDRRQRLVEGSSVCCHRWAQVAQYMSTWYTPGLPGTVATRTGRPCITSHEGQGIEKALVASPRVVGDIVATLAHGRWLGISPLFKTAPCIGISLPNGDQGGR